MRVMKKLRQVLSLAWTSKIEPVHLVRFGASKWPPQLMRLFSWPKRVSVFVGWYISSLFSIAYQV